MTPNLLNDMDSLAGLLLPAVGEGRTLDAFLLAAGMVQVADDWVHSLPGSVDRAGLRVAGHIRGPSGDIGVRAARAAIAAAVRGRRLTPSVHAAARWRELAASLLDALADALIAGDDPAPLRWQAQMVAQSVAGLPARLRRSLVRIPSAFHEFDQRPADLMRLTAEFARRHPERTRPVAVIGIRTSGSYTAPLHAAMLRRLGYRNVEVLTHRPWEPWLPGDIKRLKSVLRQGGIAALTDDPPSTGGSVARTAEAVEQLGFPRPRVVPLLPLFGQSVPPRLADYESVLLPWSEWAVHERLEPAEVERDLRRSLPGSMVRVEERLLGAEPVRGHVRALYRVTLRGRERILLVEGIGLGYLGWYSAATNERLRPHLPDVYGIQDGLLYRAWLPEHQRLAQIPSDRERNVALAVTSYLAARAQALGVAEDFALRLGRRGSVWRAAGAVLARGFGRAAEPASLLTEAAARRLLVSDQAVVADGATRMSHWFGNGYGRTVKVDADRAAFSRDDLSCYDLVYDLAGAAAGQRPSFGNLLRTVYRESTSKGVDPERWLLYQLVHLDEQLRGEPAISSSERIRARAVQAYYAELIFADTRVPASGPICAVDLDGVLETSNLGYPITTPAAALALRALARHGFRAVLATGRSLGEVQDRCHAYPIAGGVAEYGAFAFDSATGEVWSLLSGSELVQLNRLRGAVAAAGARADSAYQGSVRAYVVSKAGQRLPIDGERVTRILAATGAGLGFRVFQGERQTDFVPAGVDKGRGARLLASKLGAEAAVPLAMAVGDAEPDLPLLALAEHRYAPGNSAFALRQPPVTVLRQPCQLGFAEAVRRTLGHRPGSCNVCRPPKLSRRSTLLLDILAAQEQSGAAGKLLAAVRSWRSLRCL